MPSTTTESKSGGAPPLTTQTEKPIHYTYLKEFRVDQCPLFLQHKCTQHKPFTCFYWHFMNQRRRRPVRKRDGTFNYSPDVYCTKYDETTGLCPEGEECPYLHRTAGDTERRYHLRYYKTGVCVYDTDSRGYCVKNGPHCAFAHGIHDLRNPVYDVREVQGLEMGGGQLGSLGLEDSLGNGTATGPNSLDKERNALNEDPKWQDTNYVLANYKTEPCKRPPRLCRQGYACPQFHNSRDRRRSPKKFKYRSTPCPNVKQSDEWGDPANCDNGDNCPYCHTRTEQQFHPEIYKSTKCNDIQQTGYCPRGPFCAFAHIDKEMSAIRDITAENSNTSLAAILSNALPSTSNSSSQSQSQQQPLSVSLDCENFMPPGPVGRPRSYSTSTHPQNLETSVSLFQYHKAPGCEREDKESNVRRQLQLFESENSHERKNLFMGHSLNLSSNSVMNAFSTNYYPATDTVESVVGNALDDLSLDDINIEASLDKELENDHPTLNNVLSHTPNLNQSTSAPVTIPGSSLHNNSGMGNISPTLNSPIGSLGLGLGASLGNHRGSISNRLEGSSAMDKAAAAFYGHTNSFGNPGAHYSHFSPALYDLPQSMSPRTITSGGGSALSRTTNVDSGYNSEVKKLQDELAVSRMQIANCEENIVQTSRAAEAWKREAEDSARREKLLMEQKAELVEKMNEMQKQLNQSGGNNINSSFLFGMGSEYENISPGHLQQLKDRLKNDLEKVNQALIHQAVAKCLVCQEGARGAVLTPCNHAVVCVKCVLDLKQCPCCGSLITSWKESTSFSTLKGGL